MTDIMITEVAAVSFPNATSEQSVLLSWLCFNIQKGSWSLCFTVSISLDAEIMANEGYQSMLQNPLDFERWQKVLGEAGGVIYPHSTR